MRKTVINIHVVAVVLIMSTTASFTSCSTGSGDATNLQAQVDSLQIELKKFTDEKALTEIRLARFDSLDYEFYSGTSG